MGKRYREKEDPEFDYVNGLLLATVSRHIRSSHRLPVFRTVPSLTLSACNRNSPPKFEFLLQAVGVPLHTPSQITFDIF